MEHKLIIAIDGPAGAGKGSTSRLLADRLNYTYIDTGACYRAVAVLAKRNNIDWEDGPALAEMTAPLHFHFDTREHKQHLLVNGEDVTDFLRTHEMSHGASVVAAQIDLARALIPKFQELGQEGGIVMEGRQIGTMVFPEADVKIFLTASVEERARRRQIDLTNHGTHKELSELIEDMKARDHRDSSRPFDPLKKADDAIEVVTDGLTKDEVVDKLETIVKLKINNLLKT